MTDTVATPGMATTAAGPSVVESARDEHYPRRGRISARIMIAIGSVLVILTILSTWIRAQIIDTNGWTKTSVALLQNADIRQTVSNGLSTRLLSVVDIQDLAADKLPPALRALAPALSSAAASVVPQGIDRALATPQFQSLWEQANRRAHGRVIALLNGGGKALSTSGGEVAINLATLLDGIGARLGVGSNIGSKLPPDKRVIVLMRSKNLKAAQDGVKALKGLNIILPIIAILLFLGALALAAGWRRRALLEIGVGIIAGALVALILRRWVESYVVNNLVANTAAQPAVRAVLDIATAGWRDRGIWIVITGILIILAAMLAGPGSIERRVRGWIARPVENHPVWCGVAVTALVLVIASLGPARTPGQAIPLLVELALAIVGIYVLRRQVIAERIEGYGGVAVGAAPAVATPVVVAPAVVAVVVEETPAAEATTAPEAGAQAEADADESDEQRTRIREARFARGESEGDAAPTDSPESEPAPSEPS